MYRTKPEHSRLRRRSRLGWLAAAAALLAGCAQELSPQDTADRFWRAIVTGHPAKVRRYVTSKDQDALKNDSEILPISSFTLGRILIDGSKANVETQLVLGGDTPLPLTIETRLVQEQAQWRVDYAATVDEISTQSKLADVIGKIGAIGDNLKHGIEQSVDEVTRALPLVEQELARLEARIKQAMPALRDKLEEFSRRLEEALEPPPADPQPPSEATPDGTIAL